MAYSKYTWTDRVVQYPNRYKDQNLVQYTFTRDEGTVTSEGSFVNASRMNNIENGIYDLDILKAPLASPALTGTPTAPTAAVGTNTTQLATTAFVNAEISGDVGVANSSLVKTAINASGSAPIYACRAWVNFNGTGTVAIRASGNVSSITDNAVGDYTLNFTSALPDANYTVVAMPSYSAQFSQSYNCHLNCALDATPATGNVQIAVGLTDSAGRQDPDYVLVAVFR